MERALMFGAFDVRLDGWDVDYGAEVQPDFAATPGQEEPVDLDVEHAADGWAPVTPASPGDPRRLVFIDGVRRLEARVLARRGDAMCYGAFGSYGVGAVVADRGESRGLSTGVGQSARYADAVFGRHLIFGNGQLPDGPVKVSAPLEYLPLSTPDAEPDGPLKALQIAMRHAEVRLARELTRTATPQSREPALVICDGPLQELASAGHRDEQVLPGPRPDVARRSSHAEADARAPTDVVGLIKRVFKLYLPLTHRGVLRELRLGQRTPVFCIGADDARARYSWFLRLGTPTAVESDLTGLVRLEVGTSCGVEVARQVADETATRLPAFVPSRARDPRAPQNLLPIGALEQHLRHLLGDARLIRRKIAELIAARG